MVHPGHWMRWAIGFAADRSKPGVGESAKGTELFRSAGFMQVLISQYRGTGQHERHDAGKTSQRSTMTQKPFQHSTLLEHRWYHKPSSLVFCPTAFLRFSVPSEVCDKAGSGGNGPPSIAGCRNTATGSVCASRHVKPKGDSSYFFLEDTKP